jgi:hypothetical protein
MVGSVLRLRSTSRVSELVAECDRDVDAPIPPRRDIAS